MRTRRNGTGLELAALALAWLAVAGSAQATAPGSAASPSPASASAAEPAGATPSGVSLTTPPGWSSAPAPGGRLLVPPEGDRHIAVVDVGPADDAQSAALLGWKAYAGGLKRAFRLATLAAPRNGWDERTSLEYETSPNARAVARVLALRKGAAWTVSILDGSSATFEKRGAAVQLIVQSLRAPGYRRESFAGRAAQPLDAARIAALRAFVSDAMKTLDIPGASLALVDHGRVVFEGGLGVRALGDPAPADAHTRFMIASNTKGMTTLLLARLVDRGLLAWDEPVTQAYPGFRLGSPATTAKVELRHLVCACTGLPRKDLEVALNTRRDTPATSVFDRLAATEPTSGFGEAYQYNNLMAAAAGYVGAHAAYPKMEVGAAYDRAMREMVFDPLGMEETTFEEPAAASDRATPHGQDMDGRTRPIDLRIMGAVYPSRPAGGAWSSAHDVVRYVQDELSQGVSPDGVRVVSAANLLKRREPNVAAGEDVAYGMGLIIDRSSGVTVIHHGGSNPGFMSELFVLPDAQVGAVLLTNSDTGALLLRPFMRRLLEVLYDGEPQAAGDVAAAAAAHKAGLLKARERLTYPAAPQAAGQLAAAYVSPELGHITVRRSGDGVTFDFGQWRSRMATRRNDDGTLSFVTTEGLSDLQFVVTDKGSAKGLVLRDGQHEYRYAGAA